MASPSARPQPRVTSVLWRQHDELERVGSRHGRVSSLVLCDYGGQVQDRKMPPLLTAGFRPFFLAAGAWATLAMAVWMPLLTGQFDLPSRFDPLSLHIHEMLFGFVMAAVGGFLLTAIPNWTGRAPVAGTPLAVLLGLWLLGRVVCLTFDADPRMAGRDSRSRLPRRTGGRRGTRTAGGRQQAQLSAARAGVRAGDRQSADAPAARHRLASRHRRGDRADLGDQRTHRADIHPQLAQRARHQAGATVRRPAGSHRARECCTPA